jgi:tetratricopeptide (TPR) repeat protein
VVPHPPNDAFVGRVALLASLRQALTPNAGAARAVALTQAVHGLGGVGKTQLALRYCYDHKEEYDAVLWVTADPPSKLATDFADLARAAGLREATQTTDVNEHIRAVRRWLESDASGRWLLVIDNADEPDALRDYLPTKHNGHVLITSRRSHIPSHMRTIEVQEMKRRDSIRLLFKGSGQTDAAAANLLAKELGDFPLALAQAAGYIRDAAPLTIGGYLKLFQNRRSELLKRGDPPDGYSWTVYATLELAMRKIARPEAEELLGLIACLAPDLIPYSLLDTAFEDKLRLADATAALKRHSLVRAEEEQVEVHRLVQAVAWDRMSGEVQAQNAGRAVELLEKAFPRDGEDTRLWEKCRTLQPHADQAARLAEQCQVAQDVVANLLHSLALFDKARARFNQAAAYFRRSLAIREKILGPNHPEVARTLGNLGLVAQDQGHLAEAQRLQERALGIYEASCGSGHPEVARTLNNLGVVARAQGDLAEARRVLERALAIQEASYGPDHPMVARTLNNLGDVARQQGDLAEARRLQERALAIQEASYGLDPPVVARTLGNLGLVAQDQGDLAEARRLQERALGIKEASFGPGHPEVARTLNNLGVVAREQGDLAEARRVWERALAIQEASYGPDHPEVAGTLNNLGVVAYAQRNLAEARRLQERALGIEEATYGPDHPGVACTLLNLGIVAWDQGEMAAARRLLERALTIFTSCYGPDHRHTLLARTNLKSVLESTSPSE